LRLHRRVELGGKKKGQKIEGRKKKRRSPNAFLRDRTRWKGEGEHFYEGRGITAKNKINNLIVAPRGKQGQVRIISGKEKRHGRNRVRLEKGGENSSCPFPSGSIGRKCKEGPEKG